MYYTYSARLSLSLFVSCHIPKKAYTLNTNIFDDNKSNQIKVKFQVLCSFVLFFQSNTFYLQMLEEEKKA
jgi:hypothetical protein